MIKGFKRHNKKKAFTLVELMLLLVVLSLVIASSYSLITRKHRLVPRKSVHGQYACFKEPVELEDGSLDYKLREIMVSGDTLIRDSKKDDEEELQQCTFNFPLSASYIYMQVIGGGGAGGNANYNIADNYEHKTYNRYINLVEPGWTWREDNDYSDSYMPKETGTGSNKKKPINSWGGATFVSGNGYSTAYPTDTTPDSCYGYDEATGDNGCSGHIFKSGIQREYVDNHFTFYAREQRPDTTNKGKLTYEPMNPIINNAPDGQPNYPRRKTLFDSNLFQYIVQRYVVDRMFAYDNGGGGPTAPGYTVKPLSNSEYKCEAYPAGQQNGKTFAECLWKAYNTNKLGTANESKNITSNEWCIIPQIDFVTRSKNNTEVTWRNDNYYPGNGTLNKDEWQQINNNKNFYMKSCPLMYRYYKRRVGTEQECFGGRGGHGTYFTTVPVPYSYNFFPVLGNRWPDYAGSEYGGTTGYTPDQYTANPSLASQIIDFTSFKKIGNAEATADNAVYYTETDADDSPFATDNDGNFIIYDQGSTIHNQKKGVFKSCPETPNTGENETATCIKINGTWYEKAIDKGGNYVSAAAFYTYPKIRWGALFSVTNPPELWNWNYFVGGYPHSFKTDGTNDTEKGYAVGVGFISERDYKFNKGGDYDRSGLAKPIATACLAPGIMVFNNNHQYNNGQTVENQQGTLPKRYPMYDSSYIPIPSYFGGDNKVVPDINNVSAPNYTMNNIHNYLGSNINGHYYKWLRQLTHNSNYNHSVYGNLGKFRNWLGCHDDYCFEKKTEDNPGARYSNAAFGMKDCKGGVCNEIKDKYYTLSDCDNVPLKVPTIPNPTSGTPEEKVNALRQAVMLRSFGTPSARALSSDDMQDKYVSGVLIKKGVFYEDGTFYDCPTIQNEPDGTTGFDFNTYSNRLIFVGRTGLVLRNNYPTSVSQNADAEHEDQYDGTYSTTSTHLRNTVLSAGGLTSPANKTNLSDESVAGLKIKLHYYKHRLAYGTPGKPGVYKTVFARAFTNSSPVYINPGDGGERMPIKMSNSLNQQNANMGEITAVYFNCDNSGEHDCTHCQCVTADGGQGGISSKQETYYEYGNVRQTPDYIKKAIAKLQSIKNNGFKDSIPASGDTMSSPDSFNIFPRCSLAAPRYNEYNRNKYKFENGKTLIDATCYGNGYVEADDSYFKTNAGLFDLTTITAIANDVNVDTVGKGGDGGFVRDDCWVVPQYFEIYGLFEPLWDGTVWANGLIHDNKYNGLNNKKADGTDFTDARTTGWGVLPNYEQNSSGISPIYTYFHGDKYTDAAEAQKMNLSGYTGIYPNKLYSRNGVATSCRNRENRYGSRSMYRDADIPDDDGPDGGLSGSYVYDHNKVGYRLYGQTSYSAGGNQTWQSQYATEIQATEGQPGGVFITW